MMTNSLLLRLSDNNPLRAEDDYQCEEMTFEALLAELKMLLNSRARYSGIDDIPLINGTVVNYGIDESFSNVIEIDVRRATLEARLKNVIARFEPRLTQVTLACDPNHAQIMQFTIQAYYLHTPIFLSLSWNDSIGRFYFNE